MGTPDRFTVIQSEVLEDMDIYIKKKCPDPHTPYYDCETVSGQEVLLTITQMRDEIAKGTPIGREAAESWKGMREAEQLHAPPSH